MPVGDLDIKLLGSLYDNFPLLGTDVVCDLSSVPLIVHQEQLKLCFVVNYEFKETIGHHVSGVTVASVSNSWHEVLSLESTSHSVVNSLGFSP